jgi:hypothetical protein
MIQPDALYGLKVSHNQFKFELLATMPDDPSTVCGRWPFESADDMKVKLSRLDMSAVDYLGAEQWLKSASSVQIGHPIKGFMLLEVLGRANQSS